MLIPCFLLFETALNAEWVVNKGISIAPISQEELKDFFGLAVDFENQKPKTVSSGLHSYSWWDQFLAREPITNFSEIIIPYYKIKSSDLDSVRRLLFVLRLVCDGFVFAPVSMTKAEKSMSIHMIHPVFVPTNTIYPTMCVSEEQKSKIVTCYQSLLGYDNQVVRARANIAMDSAFPDSLRYVEAISVIEDILCNNQNERVSSCFKNALHLATKNSSETAQLSKTKAGKLYDIRSKLVHEGKHDSLNKESLKEAIEVMKYIINERIQGKIPIEGKK